MEIVSPPESGLIRAEQRDFVFRIKPRSRPDCLTQPIQRCDLRSGFWRLHGKVSRGIRPSPALSGEPGRAIRTMPTVSSPSRDPVLDVTVFWVRHRTELLAALIVALLAAGAFAGYRVYSEHRNSAAAELLAQAKSIPDYQRVIDRYPGTPASASSYLLLAETQGNKKNYKEANTTLQIFIDKFPQHDLVSTARMAMAGNFESMGKTNEALSTLQRIVANYPKSFNAPLALLSQVHLLKEKGQIEEARRVCENFLTQYRDSYLAGEASRQLRMLRPSSEVKPLPSPGEVLPSNPPPVKP